jgi:hypothetical protein
MYMVWTWATTHPGEFAVFATLALYIMLGLGGFLLGLWINNEAGFKTTETFQVFTGYRIGGLPVTEEQTRIGIGCFVPSCLLMGGLGIAYLASWLLFGS